MRSCVSHIFQGKAGWWTKGSCHGRWRLDYLSFDKAHAFNSQSKLISIFRLAAEMQFLRGLIHAGSSYNWGERWMGILWVDHHVGYATEIAAKRWR
jgi:hypothetical protein